jgi:hypothetical protein
MSSWTRYSGQRKSWFGFTPHPSIILIFCPGGATSQILPLPQTVGMDCSSYVKASLASSQSFPDSALPRLFFPRSAVRFRNTLVRIGARLYSRFLPSTTSAGKSCRSQSIRQSEKSSRDFEWGCSDGWILQLPWCISRSWWFEMNPLQD